MAENSKIEWCTHTFNPWIGCTKVSDGCKYCYAETLMDKRYGRVKWGPQGQRVRTSAANWKRPLKWNRDSAANGQRAKVFCASLADVFEDKPDQPEMDDWRAQLMQLIQDTPNLDWLLLTKRPENVMRLFDMAWRRFGGNAVTGLPPNIWIGTSVENQQTADERIPELLQIPAAVRFLSCEPLLGPITLPSWDEYIFPDGFENNGPIRTILGSSIEPDNLINWVIIGGESGPNARPFKIEWARDIVGQCQSANVPVFVKQLGRNNDWTMNMMGASWKGDNPDEWPADLKIREFPQSEAVQS